MHLCFSTFGNNLIPSNHLMEVVFSIIIVVCGLLLFMLLIGNIEVSKNFMLPYIFLWNYAQRDEYN